MMGITPICASVFTMIVMSIDRYSAIVHPMRRRPGKHATVALELNYFYDGETLFADTLCLTDNYPDGTYETSTLAS
ncbi:hypothetical protein OSTOST_18947, partial [Ostertagia ostertagi]